MWWGEPRLPHSLPALLLGRGTQRNAPGLPRGHPHPGLPLQTSHWGRVIGYAPGGHALCPPPLVMPPPAQGEAKHFLGPYHCAHHALLSLPTPPAEASLLRPPRALQGWRLGFQNCPIVWQQTPLTSNNLSPCQPRSLPQAGA